MGDPHLYGPHGDRTDFKGRNNTWYNILSTVGLNVNVLFMHEVYFWRKKKVYGSFMKAIAITAAYVAKLGGSNFTVKALYEVGKPSSMDVQIGRAHV